MSIPYTDLSWNPITGCTPDFPCWSYCWARRMAARQRGRNGYPADDPFRPTFHPDRLDEPSRHKKPKRIAVGFMGDIWNTKVPGDWRRWIFPSMLRARQHTYLFLTKRIAAAADEIDWRDSPNLWIGTSVEDQATADERIPELMRCKAAHRWLSIEPMQGPICNVVDLERTNPDWVVLGGGPFPMHPDWVRSVRDQCQAAHIPFFFKQWGDWMPASVGCGMTQTVWDAVRWHHRLWLTLDGRISTGDREPSEGFARLGKKAAGCVLDGREWREVPCP